MLVTIDKLRKKIMQNSQELREVGRQRNAYYYSLLASVNSVQRDTKQ